MTARANRNAKLMLLGTLYLSQGLPFGFFTQALPVLMREAGTSLAAIGFTSLLAAPWAFKFLWAPLVDAHGSRRLGRRRSWILPLQLAAAGVLALLAFTDATHDFTWLIAGVLITNLLAATQDIATDALAIDMLRLEERGMGNGVQVAGYRVGMIIGGGALLIVFHTAGWMVTFLAAAVLLALATLPIAMHREPAPAEPEVQPVRAIALGPRGFSAAVPAALPGLLTRPLIRPLAATLRQPGMAIWLGVLVIYKAGESFATAMLRPMLVDLGLDMLQIGLLLGLAGFVAGLAGALTGGWAITRMGRYRALIAFALVQAAAVALYIVPAAGVPDLALLYLVCAVEHFAGGMATAALFTIMMDRSRSEAAATDYTVQASVVVLATGGAAAVSGISAEALGYPGHFALATLLCLLAAGCAWRHARDLPR